MNSLGFFSKGLRRLWVLPKLLNCNFIWRPRNASGLLAVCCWGKKPTSNRAINFAKINNLECWFLEDGFLRSFMPGQTSQTLSIVIDKQGIYYDTIQPSYLEYLLAGDLDVLIGIRELIHKAQVKILENHISKYNHALKYVNPESGQQGCKSKTKNAISLMKLSRVLVVDQTEGDMSIKQGNATSKSFIDMLDAARRENPSAMIYVKTHPEVTSRKKKGYLTHIQDNDRVVMIRENVNPIDLIQNMDKVYVVTSQMGFEALMCGKPVICFGVPWYAGWGLTDDRVIDSPAWKRRTKKRTVEELFAAAYIHYTRYLNPFTHERGGIMDVIDWLILQKKMVAQPFTRNFNQIYG